MAIASPSAPSFCCSTPRSAFTQRRSLHPISWRPKTSFPSLTVRAARPATVSRLKAASSSDGEVVEPEEAEPEEVEEYYELIHDSPRRRRRGCPVYVALPLDFMDPTTVTMRRKKAMVHSFNAMAVAGVEGVIVEVWWGLVEGKSPETYNWRGYLDIVEIAHRTGLKVRAVLAFHQRGFSPDDPFWVPLPLWVVKEMERDPEIVFSDKYGRKNWEYISLGCDVLPVLCGRSPIQAYSDFMRNFRETFSSYLGDTITGVQVGLGPDGELRYPSCPSWRLSSTWLAPFGMGEFQADDKYMLASLNAWADKVGKPGWGDGAPVGASSLFEDPESTPFFREHGEWRQPYAEFFLEWYSGMLLLHGERICREAQMIFQGSEITMSGKMGSVHWYYNAKSRPLELTSGYYDTAIRDGLTPFMQMLGRYDFSLCCSGVEMQDGSSRPDTYVKQLLVVARNCKVSVVGENFLDRLDGGLYRRVVRMGKLYSGGVGAPLFSFNMYRMNQYFFRPYRWDSFVQFVHQMSEVNSDIGGGGGCGGDYSSSPLAVAAFTGAVVSY